MKVLELFCGAGGWTRGFLPYGDECVGIDIKECYEPYPATFIKKDVREVNGKQFKDFDVVIGSPPCTHFSNARYQNSYVSKPTPELGFPLINEFWRIVQEVKPKYYAMENIKALTKYYDKKPQWEFYISKGGRRCLWTNISIPLVPEVKFNHKIRDIHGWEKHRWKRAFIPQEIAGIVATAVHR